MKIVAKRDQCIIKLEDRTGELFALCPVDSFPGLAVEPVSDSSRYFVLRLQDSSGWCLQSYNEQLMDTLI